MVTATPPAPKVKQFPCPSCGAKLEFNPHAGQLKCPYCGWEHAIAQTAEDIVERSYTEYLQTKHTPMTKLSETALEVSCPGCRASITFQPPDTAGKCPFCATGIVTQGKAAGNVIEPEGILPFGVSQNQARQRIRKWIENRWFAPNALKQMAQQEGLQGVYLPFWTYDTYTVSHYTGMRGEHYYVTETRTETDADGKTSTHTEQVQRTNWWPTSGTVEQFFDDVLIPATLRVQGQDLHKLEPWPLENLKPYDSAYLAGFKAQRYQVPLDQGFETAKQRMKGDIEGTVTDHIGGDDQQITSLSTDYSAITFKHILLPVWISAYRYNNKQFQVIVNAQTGAVLGDRPWSKVKIGLAIAAGIGLLTGGIWFYNTHVRYVPSVRPSTSGQVLRSGRAIERTLRQNSPKRESSRSSSSRSSRRR
jgi:ribosomal protein S27E